MTSPDPRSMIHDSMPFTRKLGIEPVEVTPAAVALSLEWAEDLCTAGGILHGGALMALADSAAATCAFLNLPEGAIGTSTIESKTNFLGAVREGAVTATARPLHVGGTTIVLETDLTDATGRLVGKVIQTQSVLRPRG